MDDKYGYSTRKSVKQNVLKITANLGESTNERKPPMLRKLSIIAYFIRD